MTPRTITLLCLPLALAGGGVAVHATQRVRAHERELAQLQAAGKAAGDALVSTLRPELVDRQRETFDRRRAVALSLAAARRDRILGVLGAGAAGLLAAGLTVLRRISAEIEADRRHLREQGAYRRPDES